MSIASQKIEQITSYYIFHKQIKCIFNSGINPFYEGVNIWDRLARDVNKAQLLYVIDINWINCWKKYSGYNLFCSYLEQNKSENLISKEDCKKEIEEICNNMKNTNEITNSEEYKPPPLIDNESYLNTFIHKLVLNVEDFDCVLDEKTYKLFEKLSSGYSFFSFFKANKEQLKGIISDKVIILLMKKELKMKFIFFGGKSYNKNLLQLTADFTQSLGIKCFNIIRYIENLDYKYTDFYIHFTLKKKSDELIQYLIKNNIEELDSSFETTPTGEIYFMLYNDIKYKELLQNKKTSLLISKFYSVNKAKFIGLNNIGATCYMNATLQCLINIDALTRFLLNKDNYSEITNDLNLCELTSCYSELLFNVCCDDNIKSYSPNKFKEIISRKNPLFKGIQANDSKDLINFLLEEMNNELKNFKNKNIDNNNNNSIPFDPDQTNKFQMLEFFKNTTKKNNKSIISIIFFVLLENITKCQNCNIQKFNYQVSFFLEFPLEPIFNFCNTNNIPTINYRNYSKNKICISLFACFEYFRQVTFFTGENRIYCDRCKSQSDAIYINNIYTFPPTLIIILNRGKGNLFQCDVDFPQNLNLQNYAQCNKSNVNYKLRGVITHLGESGMSGHFIAYCKHRITDMWYCYNDSTVTLCQDQENDFRKGTPYILFYDSIDGKYNFIFDEIANNNNDIININQNNMNMNNNIFNNRTFNNNFNINNNIQNMFMNCLNNQNPLNKNNNMINNNIFNNNSFNMNNNMINSMPNMGNMNNMNNMINNRMFNMNTMNNNCMPMNNRMYNTNFSNNMNGISNMNNFNNL